MRRAVLAILAALSLAAPSGAWADEIAARGARLTPVEDGFALEAEFEIDLTGRLEDALHKGVALYFLAEFECTRPRWYWLDERIGAASRTTRLSYHALTRTYRLSAGALHRTFPTLGEALRALGTVRGWTVLERGQLAPATAYAGAARLRLDVSQLPKPFQVSALANPDWTVASQWQRWTFTTPAANGEARSE